MAIEHRNPARVTLDCRVSNHVSSQSSLKMPAITFVCTQSIALSGREIAEQILDITRWPEFSGYGPIPGIRSAVFESRSEGVVGTRIHVTNTDGSGHVEEITVWEPDRCIRLEFQEFTRPLSLLADKFTEQWDFSRTNNGTEVSRSFELQPRAAIFWPFLWMISLLLRKAIAAHLRQMSEDACKN